MRNNSIEAIPLIHDFCHWLKEQKKSPNTITTYKRDLERFQEWLQEKKSDINHLTKDDIQAYISFLEQKQKSVATIDKTAGAIRTFAKFLEKPDLIFGIKLEPVTKEDIEVLSSDQYELLLTQVKDDGNLRDIAIVYLLLHTGLRVSELCSLNRSSVNFFKNELIVEKGEERRTIPLSNDAKTRLEDYLKSHSSKEAIFITKLGERITERTVQYMLKKYNVNPNKLRHTFCQRLVDSRVDLDVVSRLAGIKDLNVIKRYVKSSQIKENSLGEIINNSFMEH
ncbi:tyrosine-type recombinase/integrase [Neobacillus massiliamazoniensis]|uniref:Putative tyrosine recombinase XerC-like protein n=1 Tax=Neobacillus massiliamazoniensis TaxID=1499688 RepID=A0A0U1NQY5_9BACI|nr:tyrosine-type recombinase/integrase [Neobacillus massiliamazoniensis]CRK80158.1 putative tyrosine recombinase XerC-like protein [Neobacillus massiliamazoniensis]